MISIHAPREGCDAEGDDAPAPPQISIHAPREGCDLFRRYCVRLLNDFNPRTP